MRNPVQYLTSAPRYVLNPGKYAKQDKFGAALLTFVLLAAVVSARKGLRPGVGVLGGYGPSQHDLVVFAVAGVVVAISAEILPDFVTTLLVVALIVIVLGQSDTFAGYISRGFGQLQKAAG